MNPEPVTRQPGSGRAEMATPVICRGGKIAEGQVLQNPGLCRRLCRVIYSYLQRRDSGAQESRAEQEPIDKPHDSAGQTLGSPPADPWQCPGLAPKGNVQGRGTGEHNGVCRGSTYTGLHRWWMDQVHGWRQVAPSLGKGLVGKNRVENR